MNGMTDQTPLYLSKLQAIRRGVKEGWYAVDDKGSVRSGPFATREACIDHAAPSAR
jgi:hypothetical protein